MENENPNLLPEESAYTPRPKWQVWGARFVLAVFILLLIAYYVNLSKGGL